MNQNDSTADLRGSDGFKNRQRLLVGFFVFSTFSDDESFALSLPTNDDMDNVSVVFGKQTTAGTKTKYRDFSLRSK